MVQQNYIKALANSPAGRGGGKEDALCKAAEAVSDCDLVESHIRAEMNFSLLPLQV